MLGGDGRADSPGHSAKFGSYTTMELQKKAVIDIQLVQVCHVLLAIIGLYMYNITYTLCIVKSNEVKGSYHMEKEGLMRSLKMLKKKFKIKINTLVTDRHKQIAKWLKENAANIDHRYDIWHLAKCNYNSHVHALNVLITSYTF